MPYAEKRAVVTCTDVAPPLEQNSYHSMQREHQQLATQITLGKWRNNCRRNNAEANAGATVETAAETNAEANAGATVETDAETNAKVTAEATAAALFARPYPINWTVPHGLKIQGDLALASPRLWGRGRI